MKIRQILAAILIAMIVVPTLCADWQISLPNEDDELWKYATIPCHGTGYTESAYESRVRMGTTILAETSGTTDMAAAFTDNFAPTGTPPVPWPTGAAVVEVAQGGFPQTVSYKKDAVNITLVTI